MESPSLAIRACVQWSDMKNFTRQCKAKRNNQRTRTGFIHTQPHLHFRLRIFPCIDGVPRQSQFIDNLIRNVRQSLSRKSWIESGTRTSRVSVCLVSGWLSECISNEFSLATKLQMNIWMLRWMVYWGVCVIRSHVPHTTRVHWNAQEQRPKGLTAAAESTKKCN